MSTDQQQHPQIDTPVQKRRAALLRLLLPALVVTCSAAVAVWMMQTGPKAKPRSNARIAAIVDVRPIEFGQQNTTVSVMGTVIPKREVVLKPQVSGTVIKLSDNLVPGGRFAKDQPLLSIDPSDYQLAVKQLASEVARVEADIQIELGRQRVAQKEYELLGETVSAEEKALMLREPQLENLGAVLDGTRARLAQAQLDLERTVIKAPFNAVVLSREINLGASVSPSATLATLVGSDAYWIEAMIPASQLKWINTGQKSSAEGSTVRVFDTTTWGSERFRNGQVIGLTAMVEEQGRMAKLLAEISDPLALQNSTEVQPELLLGSYVRVEIAGARLPHAAAIERDLVQDGNQVWVMDDQGTLDIRTVDVAFRGKEKVLVTAGISEGELLITSNLPSPVQGMSLRLKDTAATMPAGAEKTKP